jgi:hypothetical protein
MRLAAFLGVMLTLLLLAGAAYLPGQRWQVALYAAVVVGTITALAVLSAVGEAIAAKNGLLLRALIALLAGVGAVLSARHGPPGAVGELPFRQLQVSGVSVVGLGAALSALGLGASVLRGSHRGATLLAVVAIGLGLYALWPWLHR